VPKQSEGFTQTQNSLALKIAAALQQGWLSQVIMQLKKVSQTAADSCLQCQNTKHR